MKTIKEVQEIRKKLKDILRYHGYSSKEATDKANEIIYNIRRDDIRDQENDNKSAYVFQKIFGGGSL